MLVKRSISGTLHHATGEVMPYGELTVKLRRNAGGDGIVIPQQNEKILADEDGLVEFELYTIEDGFLPYRITLPNGQTFKCDLPPGNEITLDALMELDDLDDSASVQAAFINAIALALVWANITGKPSTFPPATHNHDDRYFTESETSAAITTAISNLIGGAPAALNTLNELAAALSDDANFGATVISQLSNKQELSEKGLVNGYAGLNGIGRLSSLQSGFNFDQEGITTVENVLCFARQGVVLDSNTIAYLPGSSPHLAVNNAANSAPFVLNEFSYDDRNSSPVDGSLFIIRNDLESILYLETAEGSPISRRFYWNRDSSAPLVVPVLPGDSFVAIYNADTDAFEVKFLFPTITALVPASVSSPYDEILMSQPDLRFGQDLYTFRGNISDGNQSIDYWNKRGEVSDFGLNSIFFIDSKNDPSQWRILDENSQLVIRAMCNDISVPAWDSSLVWLDPNDTPVDPQSVVFEVAATKKIPSSIFIPPPPIWGAIGGDVNAQSDLLALVDTRSPDLSVKMFHGAAISGFSQSLVTKVIINLSAQTDVDCLMRIEYKVFYTCSSTSGIQGSLEFGGTLPTSGRATARRTTNGSPSLAWQNAIDLAFLSTQFPVGSAGETAGVFEISGMLYAPPGANINPVLRLGSAVAVPGASLTVLPGSCGIITKMP